MLQNNKYLKRFRSDLGFSTLSALLLVAVFTSCFISTFISPKASFAELIDPKAQKKVIRVAISPDFPPFEMIRDGEVVGLDVDFIKKVVTGLGYETEILEMDFSSILAAISSGSIDCAISGITATPERAESMDFSDIYHRAKLAVFSRGDNPINSKEALYGRKIGVQLGSAMEVYLRQLNKKVSEPTGSQKDLQPIEIVSLSNNVDLIEHLKVAHLDAVMLEDIQVSEFSSDEAGALVHYVLDDENYDSGYVIGLPKGSKHLKAINDQISILKKNGWLDENVKLWLGNDKKNVKKTAFEMFKVISTGISCTLSITAVAWIFGLMFSVLFITPLRYSEIYIVRKLTIVYISVFRGTPLLVQLMIIYVGLPSISGIDMHPFMAVLIAFSLNSSAYITEIMRSGIRAVPKRQWDIARSLGISDSQIMTHIITPQAFISSIPSLVNEAVNLLKESAIVSIIGIHDIMYMAKTTSAEQYVYFTPYLIAAGIYYVCVITMTYIASLLEKYIDRKYKI